MQSPAYDGPVCPRPAALDPDRGPTERDRIGHAIVASRKVADASLSLQGAVRLRLPEAYKRKLIADIREGIDAYEAALRLGAR